MKPRLSSARKTLKAWKKICSRGFFFRKAKQRKFFAPCKQKRTKKAEMSFPLKSPKCGSIAWNSPTCLKLSQSKSLLSHNTKTKNSLQLLLQLEKRNLFLPQKSNKRMKKQVFCFSYKLLLPQNKNVLNAVFAVYLFSVKNLR